MFLNNNKIKIINNHCAKKIIQTIPDGTIKRRIFRKHQRNDNKTSTVGRGNDN